MNDIDNVRKELNQHRAKVSSREESTSADVARAVIYLIDVIDCVLDEQQTQRKAEELQEKLDAMEAEDE